MWRTPSHDLHHHRNHHRDLHHRCHRRNLGPCSEYSFNVKEAVAVGAAVTTQKAPAFALSTTSGATKSSTANASTATPTTSRGLGIGGAATQGLGVCSGSRGGQRFKGSATNSLGVSGGGRGGRGIDNNANVRYLLHEGEFCIYL